MKIELNIRKKHFYAVAAVILAISLSFLAIGLTGDDIIWHPLSQISTDSAGTRSVDANDNDIIDDSDNLSCALGNCVNPTEVSFNYALGTSRGGPAANLSCANCVNGTDINTSEVQRRVSSFCTYHRSITTINPDGTVQCGCSAGWFDCDASSANGCESTVACCAQNCVNQGFQCGVHNFCGVNTDCGSCGETSCAYPYTEGSCLNTCTGAGTCSACTPTWSDCSCADNQYDCDGLLSTGCEGTSPLVGQLCGVGGECNIQGVFACDGTTCNDTDLALGTDCTGICMSCNGAGSCTFTPDGSDTIDDDCSDYDCTNTIIGWSGSSCTRYNGEDSSDNGYCNGTGSCYAITDSCTGSAVTASCGSEECRNLSSCIPMGKVSENNALNEICYTSGQHGCNAGEECNSAGTCVSSGGTPECRYDANSKWQDWWGMFWLGTAIYWNNPTAIYYDVQVPSPYTVGSFEYFHDDYKSSWNDLTGSGDYADCTSGMCFCDYACYNEFSVCRCSTNEGTSCGATECINPGTYNCSGTCVGETPKANGIDCTGFCKSCLGGVCSNTPDGGEDYGDCTAYSCTNLISGWGTGADSNKCMKYTGQNVLQNGLCDGFGGCNSRSESCTGSIQSGGAVCGDTACKKPGVCIAGSAITSYDSVSEVCYVGGESCGSGMICDSTGDCVASCTNDCSPSGSKTCWSGDSYTCGNYDADACLEWGSVVDCNCRTCNAGACTTTPITSGCCYDVTTTSHFYDWQYGDLDGDNNDETVIMWNGAVIKCWTTATSATIGGVSCIHSSNPATVTSYTAGSDDYTRSTYVTYYYDESGPPWYDEYWAYLYYVCKS
jgi:hypothetical protein